MLVKVCLYILCIGTILLDPYRVVLLLGLLGRQWPQVVEIRVQMQMYRSVVEGLFVQYQGVSAIRP